jgi:hypothetical protein
MEEANTRGAQSITANAELVMVCASCLPANGQQETSCKLGKGGRWVYPGVKTRPLGQEQRTSEQIVKNSKVWAFDDQQTGQRSTLELRCSYIKAKLREFVQAIAGHLQRTRDLALLERAELKANAPLGFSANFSLRAHQRVERS